MASSNGIQHAVDVIKKSPVADVHLDEVKETIEKELGRASHAVSRMAKQVELSARENPRATAGVLLGVGVLFGAVLHSVLRPAPTAREVLWKALGEGADRTGSTFKSGWSTLRRSMR